MILVFSSGVLPCIQCSSSSPTGSSSTGVRCFSSGDLRDRLCFFFPSLARGCEHLLPVQVSGLLCCCGLLVWYMFTKKGRIVMVCKRHLCIITSIHHPYLFSPDWVHICWSTYDVISDTMFRIILECKRHRQ